MRTMTQAAEPAEPDTLVARARQLRRDQTDAERLLWGHLRARRLGGVKFRRQDPRAPYIVDFICLERRLVVDLDGSRHGDDKAIAYDGRRSAFLNAQGFRVLRFWNTDVLKHLDGVLDDIRRELEAP
jgi:very-short-patch-repair endonuclease